MVKVFILFAQTPDGPQEILGIFKRYDRALEKRLDFMMIAVPGTRCWIEPQILE